MPTHYAYLNKVPVFSWRRADTDTGVAWQMLGALAVVLAVTYACAPRRAQRVQSPGSAWFWIVFPPTGLAAAATIGMFVAWPHYVDGSGSLWWELSLPRSTSRQFLSGEQYHRIVLGEQLRRVLPIVATTGTGVCVWAWATGRR